MNLSPGAGPWIAWDDKLSGFGVKVLPSGTKSFLINYRANGGGRYAPNRRLVVGRFGRMTVDQARRQAQALLGTRGRGRRSLKGTEGGEGVADAEGSVRRIP